MGSEAKAEKTSADLGAITNELRKILHGRVLTEDHLQQLEAIREVVARGIKKHTDRILGLDVQGPLQPIEGFGVTPTGRLHDSEPAYQNMPIPRPSYPSRVTHGPPLLRPEDAEPAFSHETVRRIEERERLSAGWTDADETARRAAKAHPHPRRPGCCNVDRIGLTVDVPTNAIENRIANEGENKRG